MEKCVDEDVQAFSFSVAQKGFSPSVSCDFLLYVVNSWSRYQFICPHL
jgi:hypothetical protein